MAETKIDPDPNPWPCGVYILVDVVHFSEVVIDQWVRYWNSLNLSLVKFIGEVNTSFRHAVTIKWDYVQSGWDLVLGLGVQVEVVCFFLERSWVSFGYSFRNMWLPLWVLRLRFPVSFDPWYLFCNMNKRYEFNEPVLCTRHTMACTMQFTFSLSCHIEWLAKMLSSPEHVQRTHFSTCHGAFPCHCPWIASCVKISSELTRIFSLYLKSPTWPWSYSPSTLKQDAENEHLFSLLM